MDEGPQRSKVEWENDKWLRINELIDENLGKTEPRWRLTFMGQLGRSGGRAI
jgi:hypothetical protein